MRTFYYPLLMLMNNAASTSFRRPGVFITNEIALPGSNQLRLTTNSNNVSKDSFEHRSPESQGVSSQGILDFIQVANQSDLEWHSFMILRHGYVIAEGWWEPFKPYFKHRLYSLSKSFCSIAVGMMIDEGKLTLEDKVVSFFPEFLPENVTPYLQQMDIRTLLTMTTGHGTDSFDKMLETSGMSWISIFLEQAVDHEPGRKFVYDTGATYMLSAIIQYITGESLEDYLRSRLFEPLGITDFVWKKSPEDITIGGVGLQLTTESIARFGQLLLQKGKWNEKQIIPEGWINEATRKQTPSHPGDSEWSQGYGFHFWQCKEASAYRADGAYGQFCIIMPRYDAVIVVTSESKNMTKSMEVIFDHLLPSFSYVPLEENYASQEMLRRITSQLQIPIPKGIKYSQISNHISSKSFAIQENEFGLEKIQFHFSPNKCRIEFISKNHQYSITAGLEKWYLNNRDHVNPFPIFYRTSLPSKIAATATWIHPYIFQVNTKFIESIHGDKYICRFIDDTIEIFLLTSVADKSERNKEKRSILRGKMDGTPIQQI